MKPKLFLPMLTLSVCITCVCANHPPKHYSSHKQNNIADHSRANAIKDTDCKAALWHHVYNPQRLKIIDSCITVTGIIEQSHAEDDGDQHLLLKPDKGQKDLLNKRNIRKKMDDLVLEVVCVNNIRLKKAKQAC